MAEFHKGTFFHNVEVEDLKGNQAGHRVVVVQAVGLTTARVLVCPVSTEKDPNIHSRLTEVGGILDPQDGIPERSYLWVHRIFPCLRERLTKKLRVAGEHGTLTPANLRSLEIALVRLFRLPGAHAASPPPTPAPAEQPPPASPPSAEGPG